MPPQKSCDSMELTDVSSASEDSFCPQHPTDAPCTNNKREIISFGDSMEERTAVRIVAGQLSAVPKSVMFIGSPTPVQIIGQLLMLTNHMKYVCHHETSLDLEISVEQAERCAGRYIKRHSLYVDNDYMGSGDSRIEEGQHNEVSVAATL
jgi:hypothetical protein